jgi:hypothetical protein
MLVMSEIQVRVRLLPPLATENAGDCFLDIGPLYALQSEGGNAGVGPKRICTSDFNVECEWWLGKCGEIYPAWSGVLRYFALQPNSLSFQNEH